MHRWKISTWKGAQHHWSLGKCKLRLQWGNASLLWAWLKLAKAKNSRVSHSSALNLSQKAEKWFSRTALGGEWWGMYRETLWVWSDHVGPSPGLMAPEFFHVFARGPDSDQWNLTFLSGQQSFILRCPLSPLRCPLGPWEGEDAKPHRSYFRR